MIGASGGTLSSADNRLTVKVPAGALAAETRLSISPISNTAHGGIGTAYRLEGTETFAQPVSLSFTFTDAEIANTAPEFLDVAFQTTDGFWQLADSVTVDASAKTITASTTHFSDWSVFSRLKLIPASARVKVDGAKVFELSLCAAWGIRSKPDDVTDRTFSCRAFGPSSVYGAQVTGSWAVNGVVGGNSTIGTIFDDIQRGGYAAPSKKPSPDTVTVSVQITNPVKPQEKGRLSSTVTITEEEPKQLLDVTATYAQQGQLLTAFVKGNVRDDGVTFQLQFPITGDEMPTFVNQLGGGVTGLMDTRVGCINPTSSGVWDELNVSSVVLSGNFVTLSGTKSTSAITLGVGEGDCAVDTRVEPVKTTSSGVMITLPTQLFTSTTPPATPISVTQDGWTLTFTTVR